MKKHRFLKIFFVVLVFITVASVVVFAVWFYPILFKTVALAEQNLELDPTKAVFVDFTRPVLIKDYEGRIQIIPSEEARFTWENENKRLVVTPIKFWQIETSYEIILPEGRSAVLTKIPETKVLFSTIKYPKVVGFTPAEGEKDVILDIEDPIMVNFSRPMKDFSIKFTVDPPSKMFYQSNADKTRFNLIPKEKIGSEKNGGKKFTVTVYTKYARDKEGDYKNIYQSSFETLSPHPEEWEEDFTLRIAQAKRLTQPKITEGKYIDIHLDTQILSIFEDGKLLDSFLISSGKKGMGTPTGTFKVYNKHPRAWSRTYGLYMPYWMAFFSSGKYGIHELPEWPGGYKEGANHLGIPVSHGCVRLGIGPAKTVYEWAEVGTPVVVY